ncbi:CopG family ribbon-helix-helix protein [Methylovirgula sp. 4M-Z18]|uniref:CopG family ribbon-helix-helix protein n=1 Tax=Methylovirgula sp. 4M-Z18 TaxID=2293567 RepID=UPI000E2F0350|nr:ribbon-helix-helix protein, CopG family [Methylovirgula sp. 4M-Z18]RFB78488.1 ribbon-helix-helix protein, CopG family [Methylovirgula sp. 4M-Z18]
MSSSVFSVRLDIAAKKRLEALAKSTGRSRSFLAAEAINDYLADNEWQIAGIQKAIESLDANGGVRDGDVRAWIESWDTPAEIARPKPGKA